MKNKEMQKAQIIRSGYKKGNRKGGRLNDLEETEEGAQGEEEEGNAEELMADDYEEELGQLFMFEELCEPCGKGPLTFYQDQWETHDPWSVENNSKAATTITDHQLPLLMAKDVVVDTEARSSARL